MFGNSVLRLASAVAFSLAAVTGLNAQGKPTSTAAADTGDTYTTLDTYGLGEILPGSLSDVTARARAAMIRMKIVEDQARPSSTRSRELRGKKGLVDVVIRLRSQSSSTTRVEVHARRGAADYDVKLAQQLIDAIKKSS